MHQIRFTQQTVNMFLHMRSAGKCDGVWFSDAPLARFNSSSASSYSSQHQQVTTTTKAGHQ